MRRRWLEKLPNGNWLDTTTVEMYLPPGTGFDLEVLKKDVVNGLTMALCGASFRTYPRPRWLGCEISTIQVVLMEAVHGLATAIFQQLMQDKGSSHADHGADYAEAGVPAEEVELHRDLEPAMALDDLLPVMGVSEAAFEAQGASVWPTLNSGSTVPLAGASDSDVFAAEQREDPLSQAAGFWVSHWRSSSCSRCASLHLRSSWASTSLVLVRAGEVTQRAREVASMQAPTKRPGQPVSLST